MFELSQSTFYWISLAINVVFIFLALYTLWRIESSSESSSKYIGNAATMTQDALKAFKQWTTELKVTVAHENAPKSDGEDKLGGKVYNQKQAQMLLAEMQKMAISIEEMDTQRLQAMMRELDGVIGGMEMKEPLDDENRVELSRLRLQRAALETEVMQLQARLDESTKNLSDLRRENRASFTAGSALDLLKSVNERLFAELKTMRDRMLSAEALAAQLSAGSGQEGPEAAVTVLDGAPADKVVPFGAKNDTKQLQKRIRDLEVDRGKLLSQVESVTQELSRTLREKAMIEERFLKLDEIAR